MYIMYLVFTGSRSPVEPWFGRVTRFTQIRPSKAIMDIFSLSIINL